jgi:hypothetical protein
MQLLVLLHNLKYSFIARTWNVLSPTAFSSPPTYSWVLAAFEPVYSLRYPPPAASYVPRADTVGRCNTPSSHRRQTEDKGICRIHPVLEDEDMAVNIFLAAATLCRAITGS